MYATLAKKDPTFHAFILEKMNDKTCGYSSLLRFSIVKECHIPIAKVLKIILNKFDQESFSFVFNGQSLQITLEDIWHLTGLPINGLPVVPKVQCDKAAFKRVFNMTLQTEGDSRATRSSIKQLVLSHKTNNNNEIRMKALLFMIIIYLIEPTNTGGKLSSQSIQFVEKLKEVDSYSWGAALLCNLYYSFKRNDGTIARHIAATGNHWVTLAFFLLRIPKLRELFFNPDKFRAMQAMPNDIPLLVRVMEHFGNFDHSLHDSKVAEVEALLNGLGADDIVLRPYEDMTFQMPFQADVAFAKYIGFIFGIAKTYPHKPHEVSHQFEEGAFAGPQRIPDIDWESGQAGIKSNHGNTNKNLPLKFSLLLQHWNAARENFSQHGIPHGTHVHIEPIAVHLVDSDDEMDGSRDSACRAINIPTHWSAGDQIEIKYSNFQSAAPRARLDDAIVNYYARCWLSPPTGYFLADPLLYTSVNSWVNATNKPFTSIHNGLKRSKIFLNSYVLLPIVELYHWSLVIVCMPDIDHPYMELIHLDPATGSHAKESVLGKIKRFLEEEWRILQEEPDAYEIPFAKILPGSLSVEVAEWKIKVPQQQNSYDCGPYVLLFMKHFIQHAPWTRDKLHSMFEKHWIDPEDASTLRKEIYDDLEKKFQEQQAVPEEAWARDRVHKATTSPSICEETPPSPGPFENSDDEQNFLHQQNLSSPSPKIAKLKQSMLYKEKKRLDVKSDVKSNMGRGKREKKPTDKFNEYLNSLPSKRLKTGR